MLDNFSLSPVLLKQPENWQAMEFDTLNMGIRGDDLHDIRDYQHPDVSDDADGVAQVGTEPSYSSFTEPVTASNVPLTGRRNYRPAYEFYYQPDGKAAIGLIDEAKQAMEIEKAIIEGNALLSHSKGLIELSGIQKGKLLTIGALVDGAWVYLSLRFI